MTTDAGQPDRIPRRAILAQAALASLAAAGARETSAQTTAPSRTPPSWITPITAKSIEQGLSFLVSQQQDDGGFGSGEFTHSVAVSALAGAALLASGSTPGRGAFGSQLDRSIDFLLANATASGFINVPNPNDRGPMFGHGYATLFLAQCYGMTQRLDVREKLAKAVELIVNTQNHEGGWRYEPRQVDEADVPVTAGQVVALRAAHDAGLHVSRSTIDRSLAYLRRLQNPDGGFRYMANKPPSAFPRSAAAVVALYAGGAYDDPAIQRGLDYLMQFVPRSSDHEHEGYYFFGQYYAAQAMWQAGGQSWEQWYPAVRDSLLSWQGADGSWRDPICTEYGTAMACLVLQMPNHQVPIFER